MPSNLDILGIRGTTAIVTGATGFLGSSLCRLLAQVGVNLVMVDIDISRLKSLKVEILELTDIKIDFFDCDLEDNESRTSLVRALSKIGGGFDFLINNAAFVGTTNLPGWNVAFEDQSVDVWRRCQEVNLTAVFELCQKLSPLIAKSSKASIVNVSSIYGDLAPDWNLYEGTSMGNPVAYGVSKAGLNQLTRWLAATLGPNVRVNSVAPGGISRHQNIAFTEKYVNKVPLGRMATEQDICGAILFLLSDLSSYVTGQNLTVDGGYSIS